MTETKLTELKETARKILSYNRMQLLNKHPFIGNIAMNLDIVPTRDARCDTAMTDGKTIYFDIDFLSRLNPDEIQFVLGHEIWHVIMLHFLRGDKKEHGIFNIACDMEVNQILDNDGFLPPADAIFPNSRHSRKCQYTFDDGLSAEEYYDLIQNWMKSHTVVDKDDNDNGKGNGSDSQSQTSQTKPTESQKKPKKDRNQKCGGQFDKHFDKNEDQEKALKDAMSQGAEDKYGSKGADEDYKPVTIKNESEQREATEKVREMVVSSAQSYERTRGELPAYIKKQVDKLLESKLPWRELLAAFITSGFQSKTNWNIPNRRFAYRGTYLPSHRGDMMRIAVGIDTSGSCEQDCEKFLTELNAIAKNFDSYELHVIQCDAEVKDYQVYDQNNPLDPTNPIEFKGFGGTKLHPIFSYLDLNDIDVDAVVVFTDGMCENFDKNEIFDLPIMWMITGNHHCNNLNVGEKIHIDKK